MKILVGIKRVVDHNVNIHVLDDGSGIDTRQVKMAINPFCEIAVEQAVQLKEQGIASEVIVVSVGGSDAQEQLRSALALGADRAILVNSPTALSSINIAKVLQALVNQEQPDLVILGKQAIDSDNNQTGQALAGMLNWPQGTFASGLTIDKSNRSLTITREIDGGLQTLVSPLPAVVTTDLRLNTPRFTSLPNIMKAKRKPLTELPLETLNVELIEQVTQLNVAAPQQRQAGVRVASVDELIEKLKNEAKVLK